MIYVKTQFHKHYFSRHTTQEIAVYFVHKNIEHFVTYAVVVCYSLYIMMADLKNCFYRYLFNKCRFVPFNRNVSTSKFFVVQNIALPCIINFDSQNNEKVLLFICARNLTLNLLAHTLYIFIHVSVFLSIKFSVVT